MNTWFCVCDEIMLYMNDIEKNTNRKINKKNKNIIIFILQSFECNNLEH